jgi:hypothetical protein
VRDLIPSPVRATSRLPHSSDYPANSSCRPPVTLPPNRLDHSRLSLVHIISPTHLRLLVPIHSSHFGNSCLIVLFKLYSVLSNGRLPYLGLVGIFAAQNIHTFPISRFNLSFRQVTPVGTPYMRHPMLPHFGFGRGGTFPMCNDVTTTLIFLQPNIDPLSCFVSECVS